MDSCVANTPEAANLKLEHRAVLETVEAINIETATPASTNDVLVVLPDHERESLEATYQSALPKAVAKILATLQDRGLLSSIKRGRTRLYYVPGSLTPQVCASTAEPSRRRRVLELVGRVVAALRRAARAQEVVDYAEAEGLAGDIPADMIKRDLANLVRTGELRVVARVRGDGEGTNLYLPSELDPAEYLPEDPLTWLEELKATFDAVWEERMAVAQAASRTPVPPSTGHVRERFRAEYPDHPKLRDPQMLVNGMQQLSRGGRACVRAVRRKGERALLWAPVEVADEKLDLGAAHISDSERLGEAVKRALAALNLPAVTVRDVTDQLELDEILRPAGRQPIHVILSDLAKEILHNSDGTKTKRVHQRVLRAGLVEGTSYYTIPGIEGVDAYLEKLRLQREWPTLCARERLESLASCALPSVRFGRVQLIVAECTEIARRADVIAGKLTVQAWSEDVHEIADQAKSCARDAAAARPELKHVVSAGAPLQVTSGFTAQQLGALILPRYPLAGLDATPSRLVPLLAPRIRRVPNPDHVRRFSEDPSTAAQCLFERVEALTYSAFRWGDSDEKYYANLAVTTLGRLRDHRYVVPGLHSDRFEERQIAVSCLAFLGDPGGDLPRIAREDPDSVVQGAASWGVQFVREVEGAIAVADTELNDAG